MKTKAILYGVLFVVVVFAGVYGFVVDKNKYGFYEPSPDEACFGTWVNTEYPGSPESYQKMVSHRWGSYDIYMSATNEAPDCRGSGIITYKWVDADGGTWYRFYCREEWTTEALFSLERISKDGRVKECVWRHGDFPSKDDILSRNKASHYRVYRLEK